MNNTKRLWFYGFTAGAAAAAIDVALIVKMDAHASAFVVVQAALFWCAAGWFVVASRSGLPSYAHGVAATVLLNLPWYVNLAIATNQLTLLPPLLAMSVIFGAGFGWAHRRAWQM